jgi:hypothetical protein
MDRDILVHYSGAGDCACAVHIGPPRLEIGQAIDIIDAESDNVAYALFVEYVDYDSEDNVTFYGFGSEQFSPPDLNDLFNRETYATAFEDINDEPLGI